MKISSIFVYAGCFLNQYMIWHLCRIVTHLDYAAITNFICVKCLLYSFRHSSASNRPCLGYVTNILMLQKWVVSHHHAVRRDATKTASIHLTVALHLSLCCESDRVGFYVSQLQISLDSILEPETRAPSLSVTRRQLRIENLLW